MSKNFLFLLRHIHAFSKQTPCCQIADSKCINNWSLVRREKALRMHFHAAAASIDEQQQNNSATSTSFSLLNKNFGLVDEWAERHKQLKRLQLDYDAHDWIALVQKKFTGYGKASAVDVDIACVMAEHFELVDELVMLCYKLRHTSNATDLFPSSEYAVFRLLLKHGDIENFMKLINDPINFGLFPNEHCCCLYLIHFLDVNDLQAAARVAVYAMQQELFSQPLLNILSTVALLKFIEQHFVNGPVLLPEFEERVFPHRASTIEEEMDFNEENVKIFRFPWLKTPDSDGHFDLQRTDLLVGRSLEWFSWQLKQVEEVGDFLSDSIALLGVVLQGKWEQALSVFSTLQNEVMTTSSSVQQPILHRTLQIVLRHLKAPELDEDANNKKEQQQTDAVVGVLDEGKNNAAHKAELIEQMDNLIASMNNEGQQTTKDAVLLWQSLLHAFRPIQQSVEQQLMNEQKRQFNEWAQKRIDLINSQTERAELNVRVEEIKKRQRELAVERELLNFFESRHIWEDRALQRRTLEEELEMFKKKGTLTEDEYGQTLFQMGQLLKEGKTASQALEALDLGSDTNITVELTSKTPKARNR